MLPPVIRIETLVREGRLQEARRLGEDAVAADPYDEDAARALVDVYIDIEERCIETGVTAYMHEISDRIDQLLSSLGYRAEESRRRHARLRQTTLPGYNELHELEQLSARDGREYEAYIRARRLVADSCIAPELMEIYAVILYRWARVAMIDMVSRPLREAFFDYLALPLARPSRIHSLMLRLAIRGARKYPDFNFTRFFDLWNPRTLRDEDIVDPDRRYSLAAAAFELVIDSSDAYRFPELLERVKASAEVRMAIIREAFDTLVTRQIQAGDSGRAVDLLRLYASSTAIHAADRFHSHLLVSALRVMDGDDMWRFVEFFINWDASLLRDADYLVSGGGKSVPLASRAINRAFAAIKVDPQRHAHLLARFTDAFDCAVAASPHPDCELDVRRRAMLMSWMERGNEAVERMSAMAAMGHRSPAFWLDFADMVPSRETRLGLLALGALQLEDRNTVSDDSDVARLRLTLAQLLHLNGDDDGAATELRLSTAVAEPMARYNAVRSTLSASATPNYNNLLLYHRLAADALAVIYSSVRSVTMTVHSIHDRFIHLVSDTVPPVAVDTILWPLLSAMRPGDAVEVKRNESDVVMARPIDLAPYEALPSLYGIITDRTLIQCGGRAAPVRCDSLPQDEIGSTVKLNIYLDAEHNICGFNVKPASRQSVISLFDSKVTALVGMNGDTALLTAGPEGPDFNIPMTVPQLPGTVCRVSYYSDRQGCAVQIDFRILPADTPCGAIAAVSGRLDLHPDGTGTVRHVMVSGALAATVPRSSYVTATAIYNPVIRAWQALTLTTYT